jgi:hypothetical protein
MRPGRGAAQHLARKHVSRGGRARYLGDRQTGRLPTWPDRTFITIASIRITGYTGSKGLGGEADRVAPVPVRRPADGPGDDDPPGCSPARFGRPVWQREIASAIRA